MKPLFLSLIGAIFFAACSQQPEVAVKQAPLPPPKNIYALPLDQPLNRSLRRQENVTITMPQKIVGPGINAPERSREAISDIFWEKVGAMQYCYNQNTSDTLQISGKIVLTFTVAPSGSVSQVQLLRTDIANEQLRQCVIGALERLQFKPIADSVGTVSVTFPIIFSAGRK